MKWRYERERCRLHVSNPELDFAGLKTVLHCGLIPRNLDAIIYRGKSVTLIIRGPTLCRFMAELDRFEVQNDAGREAGVCAAQGIFLR